MAEALTPTLLLAENALEFTLIACLFRPQCCTWKDRLKPNAFKDWLEMGARFLHPGGIQAVSPGSERGSDEDPGSPCL